MDEYDEMARTAGEAGGLRPEQWPGLAHILRNVAREAVAAESEACAKVADEVANAAAAWRKSLGPNFASDDATVACTQRDTARGLASAIRSRSVKPQPTEHQSGSAEPQG